jgi:hypothetical protein
MPTPREGTRAASGLEALNPEAGDHPVPSDPLEIAAAREAAERSWREFPYYERRFGERGRRFGDSDSAWLITLCSSRGDVAKQQILWLGRVLATRGMPRYLLEKHLEFLYEALARALPKRARSYSALRFGARTLARARTRWIDATAFDELAASFARTEIAHFGELLVSAVADEGDGIDSAVTSIEAWACDEKLFPRAWVDAVRETIARARDARRKRGG